MTRINSEIRQLAIDFIECPELIDNKLTPKADLEAVSSIFWKLQCYIDDKIKAQESRHKALSFFNEEAL